MAYELVLGETGIGKWYIFNLLKILCQTELLPWLSSGKIPLLPQIKGVWLFLLSGAIFKVIFLKSNIYFSSLKNNCAYFSIDRLCLNYLPSICPAKTIIKTCVLE